MKLTPIIFLSLSGFISLAVVLGLYLGSVKKANYQYASFERNIIKEAIQSIDTLNLKYYNYYFAGNTTNRIYLANPKAPSHVLEVSSTFSDTTHYRLLIRNDSLEYRRITITIDSPYFYMADGTKPFIYRGTLSNRIATSYVDDLYFMKALPISNRSLALVAVNNLENTLEKKTGDDVKIYRDLLKEQGDGLFSTEGMIHYDKEFSRLVYVYNYRNEYIAMDTNFNLLFCGNTIDTVSRVKIKVGKISSDNSYTMSAPPMIVNKKSFLSGNYLYINSNLLSKNEDAKRFEDESIIDVYDLDTKTYKFSFYLPAFKGKKATHFIIVKNITLIALHGNSLVKYNLEKLQNEQQNMTAQLKHAF